MRKITLLCILLTALSVLISCEIKNNETPKLIEVVIENNNSTYLEGDLNGDYEAFEFSLSSDGIGYYVKENKDNTLTELTVPSSYKGLPVVGICREAFAHNDVVVSVKIPSSVVYISEYAFACSENLKSVVFDDNCKILKISDHAFEYSRALESIIIPSSVCEIGYHSFYHCESLENILVDENNQYFSSKDGNLYSKDGKKLITYAQGKKEEAFCIPNEVEIIGREAFANSQNVKSITVSDSVKTIETEAFYNCNIENICFGNDSNLLSIGKSAFALCGFLTGIEIPSSVTEIGESAFSYCRSFTDIVIPDSVMSIGSGAFDSCENLESIVLSNSITEIKTCTFGACTSLKNIEIPNSVQSIGEGAFSRCVKLENIVIPQGVTVIEGYTFNYCERLKSVQLPSSLVEIKEYAFNNCRSLSDIDIPDGVRILGEGVFAECNRLTEMVIPEGVTVISANLFKGCDNLSNLVIPSTVTHIESSAFASTRSLKTLKFNGTREQWDAIGFEITWLNDSRIWEVVCLADSEEE